MKPGPGSFSTLLENLPDAFVRHKVVTDSAGSAVDYVFLDVNAAFESMAGLSREWVIGKKVSDLPPGTKRAGFDWFNTYEKVALVGECIRFERYDHHTGRWQEITAFREETGHFVSFLRDVTETKRMQIVFLEKESGFRTFDEKAPQKIFTKDRDLRYTSCNALFARDLGIQPGEIVGKTDYDFFPQEMADKYRADDLYILRTGETAGFEEQYIRNNEMEWVYTFKTPMLDENSSITGLLGVSGNIVGRGEIEKTLKFQLEVEKVISRISSDFVNLPSAEIDEGINQALRLIGNLFNLDRSFVFLLSADGKGVHNTHEWGRSGLKPQKHKLQNIPEQDIPWMLEKLRCRENIAISSLEKMPPEAALEKDILHPLFVKALLAVPIVMSNQLLGFMGFISIMEEKEWVEEQVRLLQVVAEIISSALQRQQVERENREAQQRMLTILECMDAGICVVDMETYEILFANKYIQQTYGPLSGQKCWQLFRVGREGPCIDCTNQKLLDAAGRSNGVYKWEFQNEKNNRWYECRDTAMCWLDGRMVRLQIATDVTESRRAEKEIAEKNKILALLNTFALEQAGIREYAKLVRLILEQLNKSTEALFSVFSLYNETEKTLTTDKVLAEQKLIDMIIRMGQKKILHTVTPVSDALFQEITTSTVGFRKTLTEATGGAIPPAVSATIQKMFGMKSFIGLAHVVDGHLYGVSMIGLKKENADINLDYLQSFAHLSAISLRRLLAEEQLAEHALEMEELYHLLDEELEKARLLHERLLPGMLPEIPGISLAAHYQPAKKLGGDLIDVCRVGSKLIFYLSDVSGHGLDGAMLSVFVKHTIKGFLSFSEDLHPAAILRYLAERFYEEQYPEQYYISIFLAVLDLDSMELVYSGAGFQDTPLVRLGSGERGMLSVKGLFISSNFPVDMIRFQEHRLFLTPGSTLYFNTDGLTEQGNSGAYYMERLPGVFYEYAHLPPHLIAQAVCDDFRRFNDGSLQGDDDISFLVLQVDPAGQQDETRAP